MNAKTDMSYIQKRNDIEYAQLENEREKQQKEQELFERNKVEEQKQNLRLALDQQVQQNAIKSPKRHKFARGPLDVMDEREKALNREKFMALKSQFQNEYSD